MEKNVKIKGHKKAAIDYIRINSDVDTSYYSELYVDRSTGEVWSTEETRCSYVVYYDEAIIRIDEYLNDEDKEIIHFVINSLEGNTNIKLFGYDSIADFKRHFVNSVKSIATELCTEWERERNNYTI